MIWLKNIGLKKGRQIKATGVAKYARLFLLAGIIAASIAGIMTYNTKRADAFGFSYRCYLNCDCVNNYHGDPNPFTPGSLRLYIFQTHETTRAIFGTAEPIPSAPWSLGSAMPLGTGRMGEHQRFIMDQLFIMRILPSLMMMTEQFVTTMMEQTFMIGTFLDAKQQLETQTLFQDLKAQAHKDYQPSTGMCVFGTNMRSMAAARFNADLTSYTLSEQSLERQLGADNTSATSGPLSDRKSRLKQVEDRFCDRYDNNRVDGQITSGLGLICKNGQPPTIKANRDIDYAGTIDQPSTLNVDFSDGAIANDSDEQDILALQNNLFSHDVFSRIPNSSLAFKQNEQLYIDLRAIVAKRAVAENSFNRIVAMKTQGTPPGGASGNSNDTAQYMAVMLKELGIPDEEIPMYIGNTDDLTKARPSYWAQLEIMGKLVYQNPSFYVDLYDTPTNVERKNTAMRAIDSIMQREIYESQRRSEMLMSLLLELSVADAQKDVQNQTNKLSPYRPD